MRRLISCAIISIGLSVLCACSQKAAHDASGQTALSLKSDSEKKRRNGTALAYKHSVVVETKAENVGAGVETVAAACGSDTANMCVVLGRSISAGERPFGSVKLRINPKGIDPMVRIAASVGSIARQETEAEDLADVIADSESRMQMLIAYRDRLEKLQSAASGDIDALVKVASELSEVQSRIERVTTDTANQRQRIETELLNVSIVVDDAAAGSTAVSDAVKGFTAELTQGIAAAITGVAYVVPWFVVLLPFFFLVRRMWRGRQLK